MISTEGDWLKVRWYKEEDLPRLAEIHAECFPKEHWTVNDFRRFTRKRNNTLKVLADQNGEVFGILLYTLTNEECRIRRIAVPEAYRRNGYGTHLVHSLTGPQSPIRRKLFTARVRGDNVAGLLFFRDNKLGFVFDPEAPRHIYRDGMEGFTFFYRKPARRPPTLVTSTGQRMG